MLSIVDCNWSDIWEVQAYIPAGLGRFRLLEAVEEMVLVEMVVEDIVLEVGMGELVVEKEVARVELEEKTKLEMVVGVVVRPEEVVVEVLVDGLVEILVQMELEWKARLDHFRLD